MFGDPDRAKGLSYLIADDSADFELGTPEKTIDADKMYKNLNFTPYMFWGEFTYYAEDYKAYKNAADLVEINGEKFGRLPEEYKGGLAALTGQFYDLRGLETEYNFASLSLIGDMGFNTTFLFLYSFTQDTITFSHIVNFSFDEAGDLALEFDDVVLEYKFVLRGFNLILTYDNVSVVLSSDLDYEGRPSLFANEAFNYHEEEQLGGILEFYIYYGSYSAPQAYVKNAEKTPYGYIAKSYPAVIKLDGDGTFTVTTTINGELTTRQYFFFLSTGLILVDEERIYYYTSAYDSDGLDALLGMMSDRDAKIMAEMNEARKRELA